MSRASHSGAVMPMGEEVNATPTEATNSSFQPVTPKKRKSETNSHPETPYVFRHSNHLSYTHGDLAGRRQAVVDSLPEEVPELPLNVFMAHLLPKVGLSGTELEQVREHVHHNLYNSDRQGWPLGDSLKEVNDFEGFGTLQADIVEAAQEILGTEPTEPAVDFLSDGNKVPGSDWDFHKTRPDGGVYLHKHTTIPRLHWKNTCRVDEYKVRRRDKDKDDDVEKVIWSMHYVLAQDISRRFTFGLTIEDREARLYFACRAFLAVSEEFNINEKWEDFVDMTLAFGFATQEQLGWDSTVGVSEDGVSTIKVENTSYEITETLSDVRSLSILGRATRVFAVKDPNGDERVIKDVWVDASREREHGIQADLIDDLNKTKGSILATLFFTHLGHEDVCTSDARVDSTATFSQDAKNSGLNFANYPTRFALKRKVRLSQQTPGVGHTPSHHTSAHTAGSLHRSHNDANRIGTHRGNQTLPEVPLPRVHYRLVIEERGTPLYDILDLGVCLSILNELVILIYGMAGVSWVHRDLSISNVYCVNGQLKLGDLEYAKRFGPQSEMDSHDLRTGTRWFWSVEIETGIYQFLPLKMVQSEESTTVPANKFKNPPRHPRAKEIAEAARAMMEDEPGSVDPMEEEVTVVTPPLTHNPLHELESTWWLLLYIFAMRRVATPSANWDRSAQIKQLDEVFPAVNFTQRVQVFATEGRLGRLTDTFDSTIRDQCQQELKAIRAALKNAFTAAESTLPESVDATQWGMKRSLYNAFKRSFQKLEAVDWPEMKQWTTKDDQGREQPVKKRRKSDSPAVTEPSSPTPSRPAKIPLHVAK